MKQNEFFLKTKIRLFGLIFFIALAGLLFITCGVIFSVQKTSDSKDIISFSFQMTGSIADGVIYKDSKMIGLSLPSGVSVRSITPTIVHSGAYYRPSGEQDFSRPVVYTVTAENGTTQTYTVIVSFVEQKWDYYFWLPRGTKSFMLSKIKGQGFLENLEYPKYDIPWASLDKTMEPEMFWSDRYFGTACMEVYMAPENDSLWVDKSKPGIKIPNEYYDEKAINTIPFKRFRISKTGFYMTFDEEHNRNIVIKLSKVK